MAYIQAVGKNRKERRYHDSSGHSSHSSRPPTVITIKPKSSASKSNRGKSSTHKALEIVDPDSPFRSISDDEDFYHGPAHAPRSPSLSPSISPGASLPPPSPPPPAPPSPPSPPPAPSPLRRQKSILLSDSRDRPGRRRRRSPTPPSPSSAVNVISEPYIEAIRTRQRSQGRGLAAATIDTPAPATPSLERLSQRLRGVKLKHEGSSKRHGRDRHHPDAPGSPSTSSESEASDTASHRTYENYHLPQSEKTIRKEYFPHRRPETLDDNASDVASVLDVMEARSVPFRPQRRWTHDDDEDEEDDRTTVKSAAINHYSKKSGRSAPHDYHHDDHIISSTSTSIRGHWDRINGGIAEVLEDPIPPTVRTSRSRREYHEEQQRSPSPPVSSSRKSTRSRPPVVVTKTEYRVPAAAAVMEDRRGFGEGGPSSSSSSRTKTEYRVKGTTDGFRRGDVHRGVSGGGGGGGGGGVREMERDGGRTVYRVG